MSLMTKMFAGVAGLTAVAAAAPSAAQYPYAYSPYGYAQPYAVNSNAAASQCTAAVQSRLYNRSSTGILGALFGVNTATNARVLSITRVTPTRTGVRVRGLATSGRAMAYSPYGVGYYGALGYSYQPDLSFRCDVDRRGYVRDVDINRR